MAQWYVDSTATGTNAGTSWANACVSCAALLALATPPVAGDQINISSGSAETYAAATTLTFPGTPANPTIIVACNKLASPPASANLVPASGTQSPSLTGTASISTTGASALTIAGSFYMRGVNFNCGTGATAANMTIGSASGSDQVFALCYFSLGTTAITSSFNIGGGGALRARFTECGFSFNNVSQRMVPNHVGLMTIRNGLINPSGALPNQLMIPGSSRSGTTIWDGFDVSPLLGGKTLFSIGTVTTREGARTIFKNVNMNPNVVVCSTGSNVSNGEVLDVISGPLGAWDVRRYCMQGQMQANNAQYRNGGQTDGNGTPYGLMLTTTSYANWYWPFEFPDFVINIPQSQVGAQRTATIYWISAQNQLGNADMWMEVYYMGVSSTQYGDSLISNGLPDPFATDNGGWPIDTTSTWTATIASPFNQYMTATFTPQVAGLLNVRLKVARSSPAILVDPAVYIS